MSEQNKSNLSEEDYLRMHLEGLESGKQQQDQPTFQQPKVNVQVDNSRASDLQYFAFDVKEFPCGIFYPSGTTIQVRPSQVKEIQEKKIHETGVESQTNRRNHKQKHIHTDTHTHTQKG
jgi:hypothetical protein